MNHEEHNVWRFVVDGVTVRFVEDTGPVRMIVEGDLPNDRVQSLAEELRSKLEKIEQTPYLTKHVA